MKSASSRRPRQLPSLRRYTVALDQATGRGVTLTEWDDLQHAQDFRTAVGGVMMQEIAGLGITLEASQIYEVLVQARETPIAAVGGSRPGAPTVAAPWTDASDVAALVGRGRCKCRSRFGWREAMRGIRLLAPGVALVPLLVCVTTVSAQSIDPVTVLQRYYEARNAGDVAGAMTVIAPDATYQTAVCVPLCVGAAEIQQREVANGIAGGNQYTVLGATRSGMMVTLRVEVRNNLARRAGVERFITDVTAEVQDGQIVAYHGALDASDPQTATYQAFQRSQATGQPTPAQAPTALPRTGDLAPRPPLRELGGGAVLLVAGLVLRALRW